MRAIRIDGGIVLLLVIVVVLAGTGVGVALSVRTDVMSEEIERGSTLGVLFVVTDGTTPVFVEALLYHPQTDRAALFDIPPYLGQMITGMNRVDGIGVAYTYDGDAVFAKRVSNVLGADLGFYITVTLEQLSGLVDLFGGVPIFLADMPNEGAEPVLLPNGDVVLDGEKAIQYLTMTLPGEDAREAIGRRQRFIIALLGRMGDVAEALAHRDASRVLAAMVQSNLDRQALVSFAGELSALESDRVIARQVEGTLREVEIEGESKTLLFPHQDGRWLQESVRQVVENLRSDDAIRDENIVIRLEILNGTTTTGLARRTAELFRGYGFDVVTIGNSPSSDVEETLVLARAGNELFAERAADIIDATQIRGDYVDGSEVDVTIILGKDFDGRYVR